MMYGVIAHFRLKPGMEDRLLEVEAEFREAGMPGLRIEFIYGIDDDPNDLYEALVFDSKEAFSAVEDIPGQAERSGKLVALIDGPIEWRTGPLVYLNSNFRQPEHYPG